MKNEAYYDFIELLEKMVWKIYIETDNEAALHFLNNLILLENN